MITRLAAPACALAALLSLVPSLVQAQSATLTLRPGGLHHLSGSPGHGTRGPPRSGDLTC